MEYIPLIIATLLATIIGYIYYSTKKIKELKRQRNINSYWADKYEQDNEINCKRIDAFERNIKDYLTLESFFTSRFETFKFIRIGSFDLRDEWSKKRFEKIKFLLILCQKALDMIETNDTYPVIVLENEIIRGSEELLMPKYKNGKFVTTTRLADLEMNHILDIDRESNPQKAKKIIERIKKEQF